MAPEATAEPASLNFYLSPFVLRISYFVLLVRNYLLKMMFLVYYIIINEKL